MPEKPVTRGHKKKQRTRRKLLAAGLQLLEERGENFSASDVSDVADVSIGTFYNYFKDRETLVDAVTEDQLFKLAAVAADEPIEDPALRVALTGARTLKRAQADHAWARLVLRLVNRPTIHHQLNSYLRDDLEAGLSEGRFNTGADDATLDQWSGILVMAMRRIVGGVAQPDIVVRTIERSLQAIGVPQQEARVIAQAADNK